MATGLTSADTFEITYLLVFGGGLATAVILMFFGSLDKRREYERGYRERATFEDEKKA